MSKLRCLFSSLAFASILFFNISASAQTEPKPDFPAQYAATAIGQAGPVAGKTFGLSVYIDGLTSDGEIQELIGILKAKKQDGVVSAMQDMKELGRVSPTGSVGVGESSASTTMAKVDNILFWPLIDPSRSGNSIMPLAPETIRSQFLPWISIRMARAVVPSRPHAR
jgi:hypothetical protein